MAVAWKYVAIIPCRGCADDDDDDYVNYCWLAAPEKLLLLLHCVVFKWMAE